MWGPDLGDNLLRAVIEVWDPETPQKTLDTIGRTVCEVLGVRSSAFYLVGEADWLLLESTHLAEQEVDDETLASLSSHAALFQDSLAPRLRLREMHRELRVTPEPHPGTVSAPLLIDGALVGLIIVGLDRRGTGRKTAGALEKICPVLARILQSTRRARQATEKVAQSRRQVEAGQSAMGAAVSLDRLLASIVAQCARSIGYDGALIVDASKDMLRPAHTWRAPQSLVAEAGSLSTLLQVECLGPTRFVTTNDDALASLGLESVLAVPIEDTDFILTLTATRTPPVSGPEELATLHAYANQLALVLSREKTFREFENAYRDTLHTTVDALELSRPELRGHHRRVADLACGIADSIGLRPESIRALEDAARVHDVGLLGGPDAMVNAALEFQHPELGAAMLSALPNGDTLARIVMEHHETFDGFGFPKNLSGDQISQEGAILGLAEFVVERTSANPVGGAESFQTAAQRLQEESGQRFSATLARSAHQHLLKIAEAPFLPGDCARIKGRPADACNGCPAASAKVPCWELEASGRRCGRHGDKDCEGCVVYQTWGRPKE